VSVVSDHLQVSAKIGVSTSKRCHRELYDLRSLSERSSEHSIPLLLNPGYRIPCVAESNGAAVNEAVIRVGDQLSWRFDLAGEGRSCRPSFYQTACGAGTSESEFNPLSGGR